jgi:hypothetical protein
LSGDAAIATIAQAGILNCRGVSVTAGNFMAGDALLPKSGVAPDKVGVPAAVRHRGYSLAYSGAVGFTADFCTVLPIEHQNDQKNCDGLRPKALAPLRGEGWVRGSR